MNWKERAAQLKSDIPALFPALKHQETPMAAKVLAALTVAYALSPIDLIPDFIPVLGYLDDLLLLPLLAGLTIRLIPQPVFAQCRREAEAAWQSNQPRRWLCAIPIVLIWALLLGLIGKAIFF